MCWLFHLSEGFLHNLSSTSFGIGNFNAKLLDLIGLIWSPALIEAGNSFLASSSSITEKQTNKPKNQTQTKPTNKQKATATMTKKPKTKQQQPNYNNKSNQKTTNQSGEKERNTA